MNVRLVLAAAVLIIIVFLAAAIVNLIKGLHLFMQLYWLSSIEVTLIKMITVQVHACCRIRISGLI